MKKIILLCLILIGAALLWIPRGPALPPGLTFAQINNPPASGAGTVTSVLGTANQITSDGNTATPTLTIPSAFIGPGSITATTTLGMKGATSGTATFTAPAIAGTVANPVVSTNVIQAPQLQIANNLCTTPAAGFFNLCVGGSGLLTATNSSGNAIGFNGTSGAMFGLTFGTATNCAGVGTAASPSVASCGSAAAGHFSCATNATGATCQVNTTAVTANSEIFVFESDTATTGTALSVTCNTGTTVNPTTRLLASWVAATSFTINLGTVTTNPACFSYFVVN